MLNMKFVATSKFSTPVQTFYRRCISFHKHSQFRYLGTEFLIYQKMPISNIVPLHYNLFINSSAMKMPKLKRIKNTSYRYLLGVMQLGLEGW